MPRRPILILTIVFVLAMVFILFSASASGKAAQTTQVGDQSYWKEQKQPHKLIYYPTSTTIKPQLKSAPTNGSRHRPVTVPTPPPSVPLDMTALKLCIERHESGFSYIAHNPHSTASGIGQWLDTTWNHYGDYARAMLAPPEIQDARMNADMALGLAHIRGEWAAQRGNCHF